MFVADHVPVSTCVYGSRSELIPLTGRQYNIELMFESENSVFFALERTGCCICC